MIYELHDTERQAAAPPIDLIKLHPYLYMYWTWECSFALQLADMAVEMRRMVREEGALLPNRQVINAVARGEAGAAMPTGPARQMLNRQRRHNHPALPGTPALAAAAVTEADDNVRRHHAFNVEVAGEVCNKFIEVLGR